MPVANSVPGSTGWTQVSSSTTLGQRQARHTCLEGDTIAVQVNYTYNSIWPIPLHQNINLSSTVQMVIEWAARRGDAAGAREVFHVMRIDAPGTGQHGQAMVLFALSLVVIMVFASIVIDLGLLRTDTAELQNALDAGAVAGAQQLPATGLAGRANVDDRSASGSSRPTTRRPEPQTSPTIAAVPSKLSGATDVHTRCRHLAPASRPPPTCHLQQHQLRRACDPTGAHRGADTRAAT